MNSILQASFHPGKSNIVYTRKAHQYDRGVIIRVSGIALPEQYQVHFSNSERGGVSTSILFSGSDIRIPDAYMQTGQYVYVWLYFAETFDKDGSSEYQIIVPVEPRPAVLNVDSSGYGDIVATLDEDDHTLIFTRK